MAGLLVAMVPSQSLHAQPGPLLPPPNSLTVSPVPPASVPVLPILPRPESPTALPPPSRPLVIPDTAPGRAIAPETAAPSYAAWEEILHALALSLVPADYEHTKDWGKQNRVFDGINADIRGGNLRLAKRTAMVNHGLWQRYRVTIVDPERTFHLTLKDLGERDERQHLLISAQFLADVDARMELWTLGVKGLNGSVRGTGTLRIDVACSYRIESSVENGFPVVRLVPEVDGVNLTLVEYTARKIGPLRGDLAEAVGDGGRAVMREIVNGQEGKLLKTLRASVEKERDRLTVSPGSWLFSE